MTWTLCPWPQRQTGSLTTSARKDSTRWADMPFGLQERCRASGRVRPGHVSGKQVASESLFAAGRSTRRGGFRRRCRWRCGLRCRCRRRGGLRRRGRRLDGTGGRRGRQRDGRRLRDESRRDAGDRQDEDEDEDGDDGEGPAARQAILAGRQRAPIARGLVPVGIGARGLARHSSGPTPGFGAAVRAVSSARVVVAVAAPDRSRSSASATPARRSATCRRPSRVERTALKPSVQARRASEPMTSSASATTARSRISPTAREG